MNDEPIKSDSEILLDGLVPIKDFINEETYDAFLRIIKYYDELEKMDFKKRSSQEYSLTSAYALLLLNSTYDLSIKEIYRKRFINSMNVEDSTLLYITDVINSKILNKKMTNIKHKTVKDSLKISLDEDDAKNAILQKSIKSIDTMIEDRNNIAHSIAVNSKGHNDLKEAMESVLYYLTWYNTALKNKFKQA